MPLDVILQQRKQGAGPAATSLVCSLLLAPRDAYSQVRVQREALHLREPQGQAGRCLESPAQVRLRDVVHRSPLLTPSFQTPSCMGSLPTAWDPDAPVGHSILARRQGAHGKGPRKGPRIWVPPQLETLRVLPAACEPAAFPHLPVQALRAPLRSSRVIVPLPERISDHTHPRMLPKGAQRCSASAPGNLCLQQHLPSLCPPPHSTATLSDSGAGLRSAVSVPELQIQA